MENGNNELKRVDTIGSVSLTPEQFERLYLGPPSQVKGDLRKTLGNPTPVGLGGFLLALTPLTMELMHWREAYGVGQATIGTYYFLGGLLAEMACVGEFILGNTFPSIFFGIYGGFFLTYGLTLSPFYGAASTEVYPKGVMDPGFLASIGWLAIWTGVLTFILFIASLRTNVFFVIAFGTLCPAFLTFGASRMYGALGDMETYYRLQFIAGALGFANQMAAWYLFAAEVLASVDFPIGLPVFDLSRYIPGASDLAKKKRRQAAETNGSA